MPQMLLIPDPQPLVERLGVDFFRHTPETAGVYVMRDAAGTVLYIGKAKNLKKRLGSYRVANPDRMPRRRLRLLRMAARIDLHRCADESTALATESELLRALRPPFNRAGTWPGTPRFLVWRTTSEGLELGITATLDPYWCSHGPLGTAVFGLRTLLTRICWCALHPERGLARMPAGWFGGVSAEVITIPAPSVQSLDLPKLDARLLKLFAGSPDNFVDWVNDQTLIQTHPFEAAVLRSDLENLSQYVRRRSRKS
jgi:predicted GIY-YIG superfamily endonuclease